MSVPENKQVVRELIADVVDRKQHDAVSEYCHDDVVMHRPGGRGEVGIKAYVAHFRRLHNAFPDFDARVRDIFGEGIRVAVRLELTGTHDGELLGVQPNGQRVAFTAQVIYHLQNGRVTEEWHESDRLSLLKQIDAY
jgi:predicted ester cyclase